jgi:uncharacterized protein YjaG (DUF416 family)
MGISLKKEKKIIKLMTLRMYLKLEKSKYVPTLDNYDRYMVCPAISSYSFGATALIFCMLFIHIMEVELFIISYGQTGVQLPVILRIFEENQNPVDMHTSIMRINILQNIKAVAPKL